MLDVFFLSNNEKFADDNFEILEEFVPNAQRVNGVKGIFEAHQACAEQSRTSHFYVVDADAIIDERFDFKFTPRNTQFEYKDVPQTDCVYVWNSHNPVNDLEYGYGGVKLFPRGRLLEAAHWNIDMTTTIGAPFVSRDQVSNVTAFNTDPFNAWKSAFRECTKLASAVIPNGVVDHNEYRLQQWCEVGADRPHGEMTIKGAKQGRDFGLRYKHNIKTLKRINDFDWLEEIYKSHA